MTETFYGPWKITVTHVQSHFAQRFEIRRSQGADGTYSVAFGVPLEVIADGPEWELEMQFFPFEEGASWEPTAVRRSTSFDLQAGLVVQLDGAAGSSGGPNADYHNLTLICTSMDPEVHPHPEPNPYDFTLPEGWQPHD